MLNDRLYGALRDLFQQEPEVCNEGEDAEFSSRPRSSRLSAGSVNVAGMLRSRDGGSATPLIVRYVGIRGGGFGSAISTV